MSRGRWSRRAAEGLAAAVVGGLLAFLIAIPVGHMLDLDAATAVAAGIGAANGLVSGWAGIYAFHTGRGLRAFVLDSTWGLIGTTGGLLVHGVQAVWPGADYVEELSRRRNRHVYGGGLSLKGGFAFTQGNVIANAAGRVGLRGESEGVARRREFVTNHEELHIWQNRWFGPGFQMIYGAWLIIGGIVGAVLWVPFRGGLGRSIETMAYYNNPFEYWAYRNDHYWPPKGVHRRLAWRGPEPVDPTLL